MIISFVSGKGGVGKTFLSSNLSTHLYRNLSKKVLLVDLGGKTSNSMLYSRFKGKLLKPIWKGIQISPFYHYKLYDTNLVDDIDIETTKKLTNIYDFIIIDFPHINVSSEKGLELLKLSDKVFLVTTESPLALRANLYLKNFLEANKINTEIIVNMYIKKIPISDISIIFEKHLLAVVPYDKNAIESELRATPLVLYNKLSKASRSIYDMGYIITGIRYYPNAIYKIWELLFS